MKIYTTLDNIKLTDIENIVLATIRGTLHEYDTIRFAGEQPIEYEVTVNPTDHNPTSNLTTFRVKCIGGDVKKTPRGLFNRVREILKPILFTYTLQGGYHDAGYDDDGDTVFILQRFKIQSGHINYYQTTGI